MAATIFYREAGPADAPVVVLPHRLSGVIPYVPQPDTGDWPIATPRLWRADYPGFGLSAMPDRAAFDYSFATYADLVDGLLAKRARLLCPYIMDYGAPVGFRLAVKHPDRVTALVVQNGNALEGLQSFWDQLRAYWADGSTRSVKRCAR